MFSKFALIVLVSLAALLTAPVRALAQGELVTPPATAPSNAETLTAPPITATIVPPGALSEPGPTALPPIDALAQPRLPEQVFYEGKVPQNISGPFTPYWKPQWLQRMQFDWTRIYASGEGATLSDQAFALESTYAAPWIFMGSPFLITPHFGAHVLTGPTVTDLPPMLYDASIEFGRLLQIAPGWQLETTVGPSYYSDYRQGRSEAFRVTGRLVGRVALSTTFEAVLGATYLARYDYPVLPVAGFVWSPTERTRLEMIFPCPQLWRQITLPPRLVPLVDNPIANWIGLTKNDEFWLFMTGGLGGNTYAIERANGDSDMATLRDFRITLGYQIRGVLGFHCGSEIGYVFGRDLKYQSDPEHYTLTDALLLRSTYAF